MERRIMVISISEIEISFCGEAESYPLEPSSAETHPIRSPTDPLSGTVELGFDPGDARIVSVSRE